MNSPALPWPSSKGISLVETAEQSALREMVRDQLSASGKPGQATSHSPELWARMVEDMSVTSIAVPEASDGLGFGLAELAIISEECGRTLRPEPVVPSAVEGVHTLVSARSADLASQTAAALSGDLIVAVSRLDADRDDIDATEGPDGWRLSGSANGVVGASVAGLVIVSARTSGGRCVFAVDASDEAVSVDVPDSLDLTRPLEVVRFSGVAARRLTPAADAPQLIRDLTLRRTITLAAENVGIMGYLLDTTKEYLSQRHQFDRPIGSFQAIKHRMADVLTALERSRAAVDYAARQYDVDPSSAGLACHIAGATASDAAVEVAQEAIQLHGGVGFTWEHHAHRYYRRALTNEALLGGARAQRAEIARELRLPGVDESA